MKREKDNTANVMEHLTRTSYGKLLRKFNFVTHGLVSCLIGLTVVENLEQAHIFST